MSGYLHDAVQASNEPCGFPDALHRFAETCQVLTEVVRTGQRPLDDVAQHLAAGLPQAYVSADFLILRSIVVEFASRAVQAVAPGRGDLVLPLLRVDMGEGQLAMALVQCLSSVPPEPSRRSRSIRELRAMRAVEVIAARCHEPHLRPDTIARSIDVSTGYLLKLLRHHCRSGFRTAVRRARVKAARTLLEESLLSVKEIAARVGYSSTSQFDRDFRRECRTTPGQYRLTRQR
jgi:AraC-like DNA-binding protein